MNRPHRHPARHLTTPDPARRRRRNLQRCSALVASLFLGVTQCDAPGVDTVSSPSTAAGATPTANAAANTAGNTAGNASSDATTTTVIPGPDGTAVEGRCTQYEDLLMIHAPAVGWDVLRMSRLAWRESHCWPAIRSTTSDTGLLQINDITLSFLNTALGEPVDRTTLTDPVQNVRAAAALCTFWVTNHRSCYQPWG
ncbi:MAG: transglycosylase SLT domain-containing protein [Acidimicrobiales bacterium]